VLRQIFDDPAGDHDWGISAVIDLTASDEAVTAMLRIMDTNGNDQAWKVRLSDSDSGAGGKA
jgi:hypothetical protein